MAFEQAKQFLRKALYGGPKSLDEIWREAERRGIDHAVLLLAAREIARAETYWRLK